MTQTPGGAPVPAGSGSGGTTDRKRFNRSTESRIACRLPASRVPSITGVRLEPGGIEATLINISTHGVAVECERRLLPRSEVTVIFVGSFQPASAAARVARCTVVGITNDGALRYQVGLAFVRPIELLESSRAEPADVPPAPVLRNRW